MQLDFTSEHIGFRCAQTIKVDIRKKKKPTTLTTTVRPPPKRPPKVHRLKDTWSYKMKSMLTDIMDGGKETAQTIMEKLKKMKGKKTEEL